MGTLNYEEAYKSGKKEYKKCISKGHSPYLPVLDEIVQADTLAEEPLGLKQIPLDRVVGTSTRGRTQAFARNFMPILDIDTEFGAKWSNLCDIQANEGIRDPIKAYEYMNHYYVVEGNKRVSVLKYYKAFSILADVTRKIPKLTDEPEVKAYYEYMAFCKDTGYYNIEFLNPGNAQKIIDVVGAPLPWSDIVREDFNKALYLFSQAYNFLGGSQLQIGIGDALASFFDVYGYDAFIEMDERQIQQNIRKCWDELKMESKDEKVDLIMDPLKEKPAEKKSLFQQLLSPSASKLTVAFLYNKEPEKSDWIYAHELGRCYLEETFPDEVTTIRIDHVTDENINDILEDLILHGTDIIFGVSPQMMKPCLKAAIEHPQVHILNCSLNAPHQYIRTYYARMYEAKFISGMIAGAMTDNNKIAYITDYPIYGITANINAFALGVASVNPHAKVYLEWSTRKGYDLDSFLKDNDLHFISNQDMITPQKQIREFGLYQRSEDGKITNLAMPLWNWGIFYEKMIKSILDKQYDSVESADGKAINYWWGLSAGIIDLIYSKNVPTGILRLADHIKQDICKNDFSPFYGEMRAQDGTLQNEANRVMPPSKIMTMNWLLDNIIGKIPSIDEFEDDARGVVELQGVDETKDAKES